MRIYHQPIAYTTGVSTNATHDVFEIVPAAEKPVILLGFEFGQTSEIGDAQEQQLELLLKRMITITSGSGGTASVEGRPSDPGDSARLYTFENGNTTKATATTTHELQRFVWNVRMSLLWVPIPEARPVAAGTTSGLVLEMVSTPTGSIAKVAGSVIIAELA